MTAVLWERAAGRQIPLLDTVQALAAGRVETWLQDPGVLRMPEFTLDELLAEFRLVRDHLEWAQDVPASVLHQVVVDTVREWRALGRGPLRVAALPQPWGPERPVELRLDSSVQPVDDVTLEVASLGDHALILGDLFQLPGPYLRALRERRGRRIAHEARRLQQLELAWLQGGDREAAGQAYRLRARSLAAGIVLEDQEPPTPDAGAPFCLDHTVVRQTVSAQGTPGWEVRWSFRVTPAPWQRDDCVGLDPGERHVVAYAAHGLRGVIRSPLQGSWTLPRLPAPRGLLNVPLDVGRARIYHRRSLCLHMLPAYDELLVLALQFRQVALEDTHWDALRQRGSPFPDYASTVGMRAALRWLMALAPLHGVEVRLTPPWMSSRTCPECLAVGRRPWTGRRFSCRRCGHTEDVGDIAAARIHRLRALNGSWRSP